MNYIDNRRWLGQHFREVAELVREWDDKEPTGDVIVEPSHKGDVTMQLNVNGTMKYVHSKYDPKREVDRLLKSFDETLSAPALFFGVGLGYHIEAFIQRYPYRKFIIFEPNLEVFVAFLKRVNLTKWKKQNIIGIYVGENALMQQWSHWVNTTKGQVQFIYLPHYENTYRHLIQTIQQELATYLKDYKFSLSADLGLQVRWTLNVINNFPNLLKTPNFLYDNRVNAEDVAIIVAAGPSLNYEIEHLRKLKEENSAYLFSVGSAINALLAHDIEPHATLSYDPTELNAKVLSALKSQDNKNIPLIYGSSIGYEALQNYPGDTYHMIMSQDKLSEHFLRAEKPIPMVYDAPSIAVVTLQVLIRLGFKKIVLVGQNLGYTGDYRYADGIRYDHVDAKLTEKELLEEIIYTVDVDGNEIRTKEGFEKMKQQYEMHMRETSDVEYINTTVGGAHIEGTTYKRLETLMKEGYFTKKSTDSLFALNCVYDLEYTEEKLAKFEEYAEEIVPQLERAIEELKKIQIAARSQQRGQLEQLFGLFDQAYANVERNHYYQFVLKSTLRVQFEQLQEYVAAIKYEDDVIRKAYVIMDAFNTYLNAIYKHHLFLQPHFEQMLIDSRAIIAKRQEEEV